MDIGLALGGLFVGFVVGLTGMGGGALMTPMLVFFFGVTPLAAVSSDLVASAVMKPFGGAVHAKHGTVNWTLVKWLVVGSVPSAFLGVFVLKALGSVAEISDVVVTLLGAALLVAAFSLIAKAYVAMREDARARAAGVRPQPAGSTKPSITVRPVPTVVIGVIGGLIVGMTSVGSGSLIIVALLLVYPSLRASQLVGTDLVQAVPLVLAAALGHLFYGDFQLDVTTSLLVGAIPGVILGGLASSRAPSGLVRRALTIVLLASGLKMVGAPITVTALLIVAAVVVGPLLWMLARRHHGLPARRPKVAHARREMAGASAP